MTAPALLHGGFLIPNASGSGVSPRMAEPDQIDFNTLAHNRWGVIEGCLVTASGLTVYVTAGTALVNGALVNVAADDVPLGIGGSQDRFDLIAVNSGGNITVITGDESADPVFHDVDPGVTVLAAVYVPVGANSLVDRVIDKRKFLARSLLTKIDPTSMLIQNRNGSGSYFEAKGDGSMTWVDAKLYRLSARTLRIEDSIDLVGGVHAGGDVAAATVTATNAVTGSNILRGTVLPGTATSGALFQNTTTGQVFAYIQGTWEELAQVNGIMPVGTVITSIRPISEMELIGWKALDGSTINESNSKFARLFATCATYFGVVSGTAPNRSMVLPNAANRALVTNFGVKAGTEVGTSNQIQLTLTQMPEHTHGVTVAAHAAKTLTGVSVSQEGDHTHVITEDGYHSHEFVPDWHQHKGWEDSLARMWGVGMNAGGNLKLDALFNDRNHPVTVSLYEWTAPTKADGTVTSTNSGHNHYPKHAGTHDHTVAGTISAYTHAVTEGKAGGTTKVDITPMHLTMFTYVKL